jgi:maleylacetoacetate isomerase
MIMLFDYWRSSAAYRVRIGLNLVGVKYHSVAVNLAEGEHGSAANLARNPQGLVPTLEIDGLVLTQSLAILEYLNDTRGGGLLPPDAPGRARVRALAYAIAMEVAPVCNLSVRTHVASLGGISADDWQRHYIAKGLAAFEALLGHDDTGRCCHGDRPTLADLCLVPQVYNADRLGIDVTSFPRLAKIVARLRKQSAFAAAHPDKVKP